jgi:predicted DNA-binding protein (MmcQ/YjbR family)
MPVLLPDLLARLAALPGVVLEHPFGPEVEVYKLGGKIFAMAVDDDGPRVTLKCDPVLAEVLRDAHPAVRPGYHTDKRHWNTVDLADPALPDDVLWNMIQGSYDLVRHALPKRVQATLQSPRP